jgi:hypothetical protein
MSGLSEISAIDAHVGNSRCAFAPQHKSSEHPKTLKTAPPSFLTGGLGKL